MNKSKINNILLKYNIIYSLTINLKDKYVEEIGDSSKLEYDGLLKTHFNDMETIIKLNGFLEGQQLPKLFKQGKVICIICKPKNNIIVGLFYHEDKDFTHYYKKAKELNEEIVSVWEQ
ncbi:hypothetical protein [Clostridium estertheticum]|uniref:Uncharacterized protein n=1 Tax=Clostridium estertheticum subsp. estertheticum TaxID=1552 RepID=A0A1J0GGA8_9CLOT|nr:hypothetical protein [Clostridium estertheticum]APC40331.1 hypothetical protein A7L45_09770 [Clostridium estertheticum subsp. estertheticum]MBU3174289.1 hypothetical protein [Clostridium estertheticum]MBZ9617852.1 hypothetical protein [Clostridium estertheticum subsp. laramiense]WAG73517.1 hypothetical protein LL032_20705 [Clostridium estertheticum]